jgi:hypothetical protein
MRGRIGAEFNVIPKELTAQLNVGKANGHTTLNPFDRRRMENHGDGEKAADVLEHEWIVKEEDVQPNQLDDVMEEEEADVKLEFREETEEEEFVYTCPDCHLDLRSLSELASHQSECVQMKWPMAIPR